MFTAMHLVTANTFIPGVMHKSKHLTDHIHSEVARLLSVIDICVVVHVCLWLSLKPSTRENKLNNKSFFFKPPHLCKPIATG